MGIAGLSSCLGDLDSVSAPGGSVTTTPSRMVMGWVARGCLVRNNSSYGQVDSRNSSNRAAVHDMSWQGLVAATVLQWTPAAGGRAIICSGSIRYGGANSFAVFYSCTLLDVAPQLLCSLMTQLGRRQFMQPLFFSLCAANSAIALRCFTPAPTHS